MTAFSFNMDFERLRRTAMMDVKTLLCEERLYECWKGPLTRWREARPKTLAGTGFVAFPRAVAPVLIYGVPPDVHSAMAQSGHLPLFLSSNMVLRKWQQPNNLLVRGRWLTPVLRSQNRCLTAGNQT
jgi:hypothetical protein